ncbi:MAG: heavy-metal-associated domain-containing protein [Candidatus Kapabacteria bacterium]|jgi:copper chaperone CopZ|nr:heavy-metal-associated domain-containing protein [Candidatus Kapabacteria bacterium]
METVYKFKTNINCGGCVANVTSALNETEGISYWEVDTMSSDKILTVKSVGISEDIIKNSVKKAGYKIESIN